MDAPQVFGKWARRYDRSRRQLIPEDWMSTLQVQLDGLARAEFEQVGCVFREKSFAVFTGKKGAGR